jgi:hypothetical protein
MKPHEPKKQGQNKNKKEGRKQRAIKNQIEKARKVLELCYCWALVINHNS